MKDNQAMWIEGEHAEDLHAAIATKLAEACEIVGRAPLSCEVNIPARPNPSPGMMPVGRITFGPTEIRPTIGTKQDLTSPPKKVTVHLFPHDDAAAMLEYFAEAVELGEIQSLDPKRMWMPEQIRDVAKALRLR